MKKMKNLLRLLSLCCIPLIFIMCIKEKPETPPDLSGTWVNLKNTDDTLFVSGNEFSRSTASKYQDYYTYTQINDASIEIQYKGFLSVYVLPKKFEYKIITDSITIFQIIGFSDYFPKREGDCFEKIN